MPLPLPLRDALAGALSLVFPTWCAGCDLPDEPLCATCRDALRPPGPGHARITRLLDDGVRVDSALRFDGVVARVIRACKEDGRTALARPLGQAVAAVLPQDAVVVPIPSSRAAMRRRGYSVVDLVVRHAAVPVARLLVPGRAAGDQRGLGRSERARNVVGTLRARVGRDAEGARVWLVDDVVTTGATLQEAARVLRAAGVDVVGAVTVAATPRHRTGG